MPKLLIAQVATAVMVDGVRTIIQPGEEIPEQNEHDTEQLLAARSATDASADAAAERDNRRAQKSAQDDFAAERAAVQSARASTEPEGDAQAQHAGDSTKGGKKKA